MAYDEIFKKASERYGVDVNLLKAVAQTESNFNAKAVSKAGAVGVMQLMPGTAKGLGVTDRYDPEQNIMGGAKYLAQLLDTWNGDTELALASYNAGTGNVKKYGKEKYSSYYTKVLGYYKGAETSTPITSTIDSTTSSLKLNWWGDIVGVVLIVLLALCAVLFLILAIGGNPVDMATGGAMKKVKKAVKGAK